MALITSFFLVDSGLVSFFDASGVFLESFILVSRGVFSSCIVTVPSSVVLGLLKRTIGGGGLAGRVFFSIPFSPEPSFFGKESYTCVGSSISMVSCLE